MVPLKPMMGTRVEIDAKVLSYYHTTRFANQRFRVWRFKNKVVDNFFSLKCFCPFKVTYHIYHSGMTFQIIWVKRHFSLKAQFFSEPPKTQRFNEDGTRQRTGCCRRSTSFFKDFLLEMVLTELKKLASVVLPRNKEPPSQGLDGGKEKERDALIAAIKSSLRKTKDPKGAQPSVLKERLLSKRAERLLLASLQCPSFATLLSETPFFKTFLQPNSTPPSSSQFLKEILLVLQRTLSSPNDLWASIEGGCFQHLLFTLATLECFSSPTPAGEDSLSDPLFKEENEWRKASQGASSSSGSNFWASGTGYGTYHDGDKIWSAVETREMNRTKEEIVSLILSCVGHVLSGSGSEDPARCAFLFDTVRSSLLLPYLVSVFPNVFDVQTSVAFQKVIFQVTLQLVKSSLFRPLLQGSFLKGLRELDLLVGRILCASQKLDGGDEEEFSMILEIRDNLSFMRTDLEFILRNPSLFQQTPCEVVPQKKSGGEEEKEEEEEEVEKESYADLLRPFLFDEHPILESGFKYKNEALSGGPVARKSIKRLLKEQASFSTVLPLHESSSVFVRVDPERINVLQALIIGPEGTPYANGCFIFDIFCKSYPDCAPTVNLRTTGNGSVGFNPNLYSCGMVCLSLLGTWSGRQDESWDPSMSTLLQLFVSIQSLIFVDQPYYNEPGFEEEMGTSSGDAESEHYSSNIRLQTTKFAILEHLQTPPPGFEEVVRLHFRLKKAAVLAQTKTWMAEHHRPDILQQVEDELTKL